ncbi:hypothetical protein H9P43_008120 [Blastocladiella emersonii ATCC 22665]|nr:hypothetical protein H9P43_008120 [Blastocladiella emersonii ATCC 22665]
MYHSLRSAAVLRRAAAAASAAGPTAARATASAPARRVLWSDARTYTTPPVIAEPHRLLQDVPRFTFLNPVMSTRMVRAYKRERNAAVAILKRHFRQPDIIQPGKPIDMQMSAVLQKLGFKAKVSWTYDFQTVESVLAFLEERSNAQLLYNLLSLASVVAGAAISWYYADQAKKREEQRYRDELKQDEERRRLEAQKQKWDALFDVSMTVPHADPLSPRLVGAIRCPDSRAVRDEILAILDADHAVHSSPFFNVIVGPSGSGKSVLVTGIFDEILEQVNRAHAADESGDDEDLRGRRVVLYTDFKDAFKVNSLEFVEERFFDFLDELQVRSERNGERIALFIDAADLMANVFDGDRLPAVMRHIHETGKFVDVFLVYNSHSAYSRAVAQPGMATQHRLITVPYIEDRSALLGYAQELRRQCAAAGLGDRWNVPEEAVVEIVGGQFDDYARIMRTIKGGHKTLREVLKELLSQSQERVEGALNMYTGKIDLTTGYYLSIAESIVARRPVSVPLHLQKQFMDLNYFFRTDTAYVPPTAAGDSSAAAAAILDERHRDGMIFYYPRDQTVFEHVLRNPQYKKHLANVRKVADRSPLISSEAAEDILAAKSATHQRGKRRSWWRFWS